jgi:large conductance mechanosensitive channel
MPEKQEKKAARKAKVVKVAKKANVAPKAIAKVGSSRMKDFLDFLRTQGAVGLAVGLVLGGATAVVVKSLIDNVVMPPLGLLLGSNQGLKGLNITIGGHIGSKTATINYGIFLNDLINFIVIALVVYIIIKIFHFDKIDKKKDQK